MAALVPLLAGCATLRSTIDGWHGGHDGLTHRQRELREALSEGDFAAALKFHEDDALLQALTAGVATYYAGQYERSAALLDTAALVADARITTSVSRGAMALVTNDMARPYEARRTERLFVPYYGMLAYARLGQWEEAAVEARRMVALLAVQGADRDGSEQALHAAMHYLAGAVFERAGERGDALVAYRNAHALLDAYPERLTADSGTDGEVLVVVERGFVAHRATETLRIPLDDDDRDELRASDESRRRAVGRLVQRLTPSVTQAGAVTGTTAFEQRDVIAPPSPESIAASRVSASRVRAEDGDDDDNDHGDHHGHHGPHMLRVAFPSLRRSPRPWAGPPRVMRDSSADSLGASALVVSASVDDASEADERRERVAVIGRAVARAAAKYAVTKAVEDEKGETAGHLAELGAAFLERADVRSWHVLPQELVVLRLRVPSGQQSLRLAVGEGASLREVDLGPVVVKPGTVTVVGARFWREPAYLSHTRCAPHEGRCRG